MISKGIVDMLGLKSKKSLTFHHQTDGQTEWVNQTVECYLWTYCNYEQEFLDEMLPLAEYANRNSLHSTVKKSPFLDNYGYLPRIHLPTTEPLHNLTSQSSIQ
jgi:hypothetical protein